MAFAVVVAVVVVVAGTTATTTTTTEVGRHGIALLNNRRHAQGRETGDPITIATLGPGNYKDQMPCFARIPDLPCHALLPYLLSLTYSLTHSYFIFRSSSHIHLLTYSRNYPERRRVTPNDKHERKSPESH